MENLLKTCVFLYYVLFLIFILSLYLLNNIVFATVVLGLIAADLITLFVLVFFRNRREIK